MFALCISAARIGNFGLGICPRVIKNMKKEASGVRITCLFSFAHWWALKILCRKTAVYDRYCARRF